MKTNVTEISAKVDRIVDGLGKPVDDGIKPTVVALMAVGIPTSGSCEGHLDHGLPYPWVDINAPYPDDPQPTPDLIAELNAANSPLRVAMEGYLDEFYAKHRADSALKLHFRNMGVYGAFRLQSVGLSRKPDADMLKQYQTEMSDFAAFLIKKIK